MDDQTPSTPTSLERVSQARQLLAEARTLSDIVKVMEMAGAAEDLAHRAARMSRISIEIAQEADAAANEAAAVKFEAEAKAAMTLDEVKATGQRHAGGGDQKSPVHDERVIPTLDDLGVSPSQAHRRQQVAAIQAEVREAYVRETMAIAGEVTRAGLLRKVQGLPEDDVVTVDVEILRADMQEQEELRREGAKVMIPGETGAQHAETEEEFEARKNRAGGGSGVNRREVVLLYIRRIMSALCSCATDLRDAGRSVAVIGRSSFALWNDAPRMPRPPNESRRPTIFGDLQLRWRRLSLPA